MAFTEWIDLTTPVEVLTPLVGRTGFGRNGILIEVTADRFFRRRIGDGLYVPPCW